MCLILFALNAHPDYPLLVAANRDEFHGRPTAPLHRWPGAAGLCAGRDLEAGGTWLGISRSGRFAAVTNYREFAPRDGARSRGELCTDWLLGDAPPEAHMDSIVRGDYAPFNLLISAWPGPLHWLSGRSGRRVALHDGVHGLSNGDLDAPWPKVRRGREALAAVAAAGADEADLFDLLGDHSPAADGELPDTGIGIERERLLAPAFIVTPGYGTRCSTLLLIDRRGRVRIVERRFGPDGTVTGSSREEFELRPTG
jgi:uncharacterized protein with NRDE domain